MSQSNKSQAKQSSDAIKAILQHKLQGDDYLITVQAESSINYKSKIDRLNKAIVIELQNIILNPNSEVINNGLVNGLTIVQENKTAILTLTLKRPLRYELIQDSHGLNIVLKNISAQSSLEPNQELSDFHYNTFNIDLHNDLLFQLFTKNLSISTGTRSTECDLEKMKAGGVHALFFSVWVPDYFLSDTIKPHFYKDYLSDFDQYKGRPFEMALDLIDRLHQEVDADPDISLALSTKDIEGNFKSGKISALMGLEGAHPLEEDINRLKVLYDKGIRYVGITWSNANVFADAAKKNRHGGLSKLGEKLVREMMALGLLIDVSHLSDKSFYQVFKICGAVYPLIATHSASRALKNHARNLTDDMIQKIKESGGVVGVVYHSGFLSKKRRADIEDLLNHIDHIVGVASIDNVALGSDFDGFIITPKGLENMSKLPNLSLGLYNRGYSFEDIEKILGANFMRVFKQVEAYKNTKHRSEQ